MSDGQRTNPIFLADAEAMHRKHPRTFELWEGRDSLQVGDMAKVCISGMERLWCEVRERNVSDGRMVYRCETRNDGFTVDLPWGSRIDVEPRHVYQFARGPFHATADGPMVATERT